MTFFGQDPLFVTSRTSTKCGPKMCSSLKDFFMSWTLTKCGLKMRPLLEDFFTSWTSTKGGPKMCSLLEDFVTSWTSTKCGTKMCPSSEDFVTSRTLFSYGPAYATAQEKWQSHLRGRHKPMVSIVGILSPNWYKMTHIASTKWQKTNDALHKQQLMPNDAALYIDGLGNEFIAITWTIWRFLRVYAGLLVNGFDDNGVCLLRGSIKACAFHAHRHALSSDLDFCLLTLFGSLTLTPMTPVIFGSKGNTIKAVKI